MRTVLSILLLLALAAGGLVGGLLWWEFKQKERVIAELEARLDRVWSEEVVADLKVNARRTNPYTGEPEMDLTFIQYAPGSETPLFQRGMVLPGEEVYVDAWVVQFERPLVEAGDGLKGKSLLMFRRAFGDLQRPADGEPLHAPADSVTEVPEVFRVDPAIPGAFESEIWSRFWTLANDPAAAEAQGVRVAQGEAPHVKVVEGQVYRLSLRASGGLAITPRLPAAVVGGAR